MFVQKEKSLPEAERPFLKCNNFIFRNKRPLQKRSSPASQNDTKLQR